MPPKPQLIDMIRTVPEVAVRIWSGGQISPFDDGVRIRFENREMTVAQEVFKEAHKVAQTLAIRWGGRMLHGIIDVLELRHAAEDVFLENLFKKRDVPSVLFVPAGVTASGYYRAMFPADLMNEGGQVMSNWTAKPDPAKCLNYDVLWIQLITAKLLTEIARQVKAEGVRIVYDIDDNLSAIPDENQAKTVYGTLEKQAEIREMIELADLVTVSTVPLGKAILNQYPGKWIKVLPNMLTANVAPRKHPSNPDFVRILWAGSATHKRDLAIIAPALRNVLRRHNGKVRFTLFGERLPDVLADCHQWVDLKKPVDFEEYHDELAMIAADFGIVPLEANEFNESKSALKGLEYAAAGYPMLLSPVAEYPAIVEAGFPAKLVSDESWEEALEWMIAHSREERDQMGKACLDWVCANRCMGTNHAQQWANTVIDVVKAPRKEQPEKLRLI